MVSTVSHDEQKISANVYVLDLMYSPFAKITYTPSSPYLFGAIAQSYLSFCLLGCSPHMAPNKT